MEMQQIFADAAFSAAVVPAGSRLVFLGYDTGSVGGNVVTRYKDSDGNFGTLAGASSGGGMSDADKFFWM